MGVQQVAPRKGIEVEFETQTPNFNTQVCPTSSGPADYLQDQDFNSTDGERTSARHGCFHPENGGEQEEGGEGGGEGQQVLPRQVLDVHRPCRSLHGPQWGRSPSTVMKQM